nr:retrovirus-related Pol polyprotein from transposon TNT 1-94 [Tanacetum cinerariifolium]
MLPLCFSIKGIRLILPNSCVRWLSVCTWCRPIRKEGCATWDRGNSTWGGRVKVFGTVSVSLGAQEIACGRGRFLAGKGVVGVLFRLILPNSCVTWLSVCTIDRPMRNKDAATWDGGKSTWGGRAKGFGTVPNIRVIPKYHSEDGNPARANIKLALGRDEIASGTDGPYLGPEQDRVVADLSQVEKDRLRADIQATNILLQSLPRDIYKLINNNTDAKDIWDNVKMLLEGSELTKDDHESQLYDEFKHFRQHKGENIHDYYVRVQRNNARGVVATGNKGAQNRADEGPVQDMAQNEENIFQGDQCDAFDSDVDEAPTAQTMSMANLSSTELVYDEAGPSYDSDTLYEVKDHDNSLDNMNESHEEREMQNNVQPNDIVDSDTEYTSNSNIISYE